MSNSHNCITNTNAPKCGILENIHENEIKDTEIDENEHHFKPISTPPEIEQNNEIKEEKGIEHVKVKKIIPVAIRKQENSIKDEELSAQQGILHFTKFLSANFAIFMKLSYEGYLKLE